MKRCIITYAEGPHEELLEVSRPGFEAFALRHNYDFVVGKVDTLKRTDLPPAWAKIQLLIDALYSYYEVVWFDCDLVIVRDEEDFPPLTNDKLHSMVRHFENYSEVPNSGVWRLTRTYGDLFSLDLLKSIRNLEVFRNHGWWEQAALLTLMGYIVPPEGSNFGNTLCKNVVHTRWYNACQFMRLAWNSHPNYRAERPRIVHCSYPNMPQRLEVMRALVKDPTFDYPRYNDLCPHCKRGGNEKVLKDNGHDVIDEDKEAPEATGQNPLVFDCISPYVPTQSITIPEEEPKKVEPVLPQEATISNKDAPTGSGGFRNKR